MFKQYPDDQCVRGIFRLFPSKSENSKRIALDIGCGAGRNTKLLLDMGFQVDAIDIVPQNIIDSKIVLSEYMCSEDKNRLDIRCEDFTKMEAENKYDLIMAWNFLYAYNNEKDDCAAKICKIQRMLNKNGKVIMSLKSDEDTWRFQGTPRENGVVDNLLYDAPGYIFYSQNDMIDVISSCGLQIDYFEKFSRVHTMDWKNISSNDMWKKKELDIREVYFAVCATKI